MLMHLNKQISKRTRWVAPRRQCQRADWQRHKPICLALRELKAGEGTGS